MVKLRDAASGGRFSRLAAAAVFDKRLSAEALRVLGALAVYVDGDGVCYPSLSRIGARLGTNRRTVQRHLRRLERAGYVETARQTRRRGGYGTNAYRLTYPPFDTAEEAGSAPATTNTAADSVADDATPDVASAGSDATPDVAPHATPGVAPDATPDVAQTSHNLSHKNQPIYARAEFSAGECAKRARRNSDAAVLHAGPLTALLAEPAPAQSYLRVRPVVRTAVVDAAAEAHRCARDEAFTRLQQDLQRGHLLERLAMHPDGPSIERDAIDAELRKPGAGAALVAASIEVRQGMSVQEAA